MPRQRRGIRGDAPQGYLFRFAPLRGHCPLRPSTAPAPCPCPVIPSQCSHWRGNPYPAPAGAEHPRGGLSKGTFRAPARGTFALGGKSTQKRRSNLRFENPLRAFTRHLSCLSLPRERCAMQISPKYCIVYASLSAVAFALKCKAAHFSTVHGKDIIKWRPLAATYLCRFAAKARFDNRPPPRRVFPKREGRSPPSLVAQGWGIFKGEGRSKLPSPLNGAFGYFCRY